jgi:hypothetical protein
MAGHAGIQFERSRELERRNPMKKLLLAAGLGLMLASGMLPAKASIVYSENFDAGGFLGSYLGDVGNFSERWTDTRYYTINNFNGWSFTGSTYLAQQISTGNQALLLNEQTGVAKYMSGLLANTLYDLTFNLSGDNRPGSNYRFLLDINGVNVLDITAQWTATTPAGHSQSIQFMTDGAGSALLKFYQGSSTQSSPIIDDIVISTVPEPTTIVAGALLLLPFGASIIRIVRKNRAA